METDLSPRKLTREVKIGSIGIGGSYPITVQSMTKTKTENIDSTVAQIKELEAAGCEIVRCAVPNKKAAVALKAIKSQVRIPVVADIHFNYRLALLALKSGVDKIRINPGNIGNRSRVEAVLGECRERCVPIRIGVNSGSIEPHILEKYGAPTARGMVESALYHIGICESFGFENLVISLKATNVPMMIQAYRMLAGKVDYPLHLGVTEAGPSWTGTIKSAIGIGALLGVGIGDTIRVSLTGDPQEEIRVGKEILKSMGLRRSGVTLISCPTCGRLETPHLIAVVKELEERVAGITKPLTVAVMGCAVNGPGEARGADLGAACGKNEALLFKNGETIGKVPSTKLVDRLYQEIVQFEG